MLTDRFGENIDLFIMGLMYGWFLSYNGILPTEVQKTAPVQLPANFIGLLFGFICVVLALYVGYLTLIEVQEYRQRKKRAAEKKEKLADEKERELRIQGWKEAYKDYHGWITDAREFENEVDEAEEALEAHSTELEGGQP